MLEHYLIGHCSPTLANLKTANLFGYRYDRAEELIVQLTELRQQLLPRGVELRLLQLGQDRALIYVYRIRRLVRDLADPEIRQFLADCGYRDFSVEGALAHLARRIMEKGGEFPHEIGLFLGYPLALSNTEVRTANAPAAGRYTVMNGKPDASSAGSKSADPFTAGCTGREELFPG